MSNDACDRVLAASRRVVRCDDRRVADGGPYPEHQRHRRENERQSHVAGLFADGGLEVDHWQIDLDDAPAPADFPGMEVDRARRGDSSPAARTAATRDA